MPAAEIVAQGGAVEALYRLRQRLGDITPLIEKIAERVVLPALARNYDESGLKTHSGVLKRAITQRGAKGNILRASSAGLRVGVDYSQVPYAKWALEGRGPVVARRAKALHFFIDGKEFFRKRVGPAPPHPVYYLTEDDHARIREMMHEYLMDELEGQLRGR